MPSFAGHSPLDYAIKDGDLAKVKGLMEVKYNPNGLNPRVVSPLMRAVQMGRNDMVQALLEGGANPNAVSATIETSAWHGMPSVPLCQALQVGKLESIKLLTQHNVVWNHINGAPIAKCWTTSPNRNLVALEFMVHQGVSFKPADWGYDSAISDYIANTSPNAAEASKTINLMIKGGADIHYNRSASSHANPSMKAPLHFAVQQVKPAFVKALLDAGANPNQKTMLGETPLHLAAEYNCTTCIAQLIEAGADIYARDGKKQPPVAKALNGGEPLTLISSAGGLHALYKDQRQAMINAQPYVSPSVRDFVLSYRLNTQPYKQFVSELPSELTPKKRARQTATKRADKELNSSKLLAQKEEKERQQARIAEQRRQRAQVEQRRKQQEAKTVVQNLIQTSKDMETLITELGKAKANCIAHKSLYRKARKFDCEYMTENGRYREFGRSKACENTRDQITPIVSKYKGTVCRDYESVESKALAIFENPLQKQAVKNEIRTRSNKHKTSVDRLASLYSLPFREMDEMRDDAQRAQERGQEEHYKAQWGRVIKAASSTSSSFDEVHQTFQQSHKAINNIVVNQVSLQRLQRQIEEKTKQIRQQQKKTSSQTYAAKSTPQPTNLTSQKTACEAKGGKFDASRNNCTIVMNKTSSSGASQPEENPWFIRKECGHTNFDDTMPKPERVCMNTAPPAKWEMKWHSKHLLGDNYKISLSIENQSDLPIEFILNGRVSGDMSHKNFDWKVTVPPHSTRSEWGGITQLSEPAHVINILDLKFRPLK
ncbi:hypothetical protein R50073_33130 [Maricurvus nonylphenolicus]